MLRYCNTPHSTISREFPQKALGLAAKDSSGLLTPFKFSRRATGDEDVTLKVMYCGICHSDLSNIKNEWGYSSYPMVSGHEFVGIVTEVGKKVSKFKVGDRVGVGCLVGACHSCDNCSRDLENYCPKPIFTYNSPYYDRLSTYGSYSDIMVANERYVVRIPDSMPLDECAPLDACHSLGCVCHGYTLDGILDTVSAPHSLLPLLGLLKSDGKLIMLGLPDKPFEVPCFPLLFGRKTVAGSTIGGMKETQEMIDFTAKHNITADIEVVPMDYVNTAMEYLAKGDVRYRFVIDVANTLSKIA
ncbi:hypothetical protein MKW92_032602 [Papaver armeniacum]|nr:hypothetical protein MKW92_032602 [Papaver armeniacum]